MKSFQINAVGATIFEGQYEVSDRAIDSHIKNLRKKCAAVDPGRPLIHSVYGVGYKLEDSCEE